MQIPYAEFALPGFVFYVLYVVGSVRCSGAADAHESIDRLTRRQVVDRGEGPHRRPVQDGLNWCGSSTGPGVAGDTARGPVDHGDTTPQSSFTLPWIGAPAWLPPTDWGPTLFYRERCSMSSAVRPRMMAREAMSTLR
jgi:hypothetical protein